MTPILIVEDELLLANYLKEVLETEGHTVVGLAHNSDETIRLFREHSPHLVCMDIKLQGKTNGIETARILREIGPFSLIYLTAQGDREIINRAQDTKPVGFLVKPVTSQTIVATITTAIANEQPSTGAKHVNVQTFSTEDDPDTISVNHANGTINIGGNDITLTPKEAAFLQVLLEQHGEVCSNLTLKQEVWGGCYVSNASLRTMVWRLRRKMKDNDIIRSVAGFGYRLNGCRQNSE